MQAATIKLFLPTGDANGVRTAEISNWTGRAIAGPRTEIGALLKRDELNRPGVYILLGYDNSGEQKIYIGEAECVQGRLKQHKNKEFWVQLIAFTSKDENLTKAHIKYLEGELIKRARAVGKAVLENGQESSSSLPESDLADMKVFLAKACQLLPVLGTDVFTEVVNQGLTTSSTLYIRRKGIEARGQRSANGFVVFKGSCAVGRETPAVPEIVTKHRAKLIEKKILVLEDGAYRFTNDQEFNSPSLAAGVLLGSSASGPLEWKNNWGCRLSFQCLTFSFICRPLSAGSASIISASSCSCSGRATM